jgi:hypothetical protein
MAPADAIASVVGDWKKDEFLMKQASTGIMATCGPKEEGVTREDVCANYKVLMPIVKYLGNLEKPIASYFHIFWGIFYYCPHMRTTLRSFTAITNMMCLHCLAC